MDKSKRFDEISIMRVMAMTMIICYHCMCFYGGIWTYLDAIHIPFWEKAAALFHTIGLNMFVFISGYLYGYLYIYRNKYHHPYEVIRKKFLRLLLPYCFWGVMIVLLFPWNTWAKMLYGVSHLWFLLMLFGVFTLTVVLQNLNAGKVKFTCWVDIGLFISGYGIWYVLSKINPNDFLCVTRIMYYFLAFMVGLFFAKSRDRWLMTQTACFVLLISILVLIVSIWCRLLIPYGMIALLRSLCAYAICVCLLIILSKVSMTGLLRTSVVQVEHLSMGIYIFNQIAMDSLFSIPVLHKWFEVHWMIGPLVLFPIGFFPPYLLSYIFNKYKLLRWSIGG